MNKYWGPHEESWRRCDMCWLQCDKSVFCTRIDIRHVHIRFMEGEDRHKSVCLIVSFCMLAISFYFLNCAIISCKLYYDNSFGCMLTNYE